MPKRIRASLTSPSSSPNPSGRRPRGPAHFASEDAAAAFDGLPEGASHYELADLLEAVGARAGWSAPLVAHFTLLLRWTTPGDWLPGAQPIVWLSVAETAARLGVSTSQVRRNEAAMHRMGALAWKDSSNHRRYGYRNEAGEIEAAWGVNLAPAASLIPQLRLLLQDAAEDRARLRYLRHTVAGARARILAALSTGLQDGLLDTASAEAWRRLIDEASRQSRATLSECELEDRLHQLDHLDAVLRQDLTGTPTPADNVAQETGDNPDEFAGEPQMRAEAGTDACPGTHPCLPPLDYSTTDPVLRNRVGRGPGREGEAVGDPDIPPPPAPARPLGLPVRAWLEILPDRIRDHLCEPRPEWPDIVDAAGRVAADLGVSTHAWGEACRTLGRERAAMALSIVAIKHDEGLIRSPGGYFRGMTRKGAAGALDLDATVFGLRDRRRRSEARNAAVGEATAIPDRPSASPASRASATPSAEAPASGGFACES